jgi:hypothetical protein
MGSEQTQCRECGGEMEVGFIAGVSEATVLQQTWVRGIPQKRWIGGLKVDRKKLRSRAGKSMQELRLSEVLRAMRRIFVRRHGGERKGRLAEVRVKGWCGRSNRVESAQLALWRES